MKKIPIDLDQLIDEATWSDHMEMGPYRYFDTETGDLVFVERELFNAVDGGEDVSEYEGSEELDLAQRVEHEDRFVPLPERFPDENFQIMEDFVTEQTEGKTKQALVDALNGRKPFRRFKDTLCDFPEVKEQYFKFEAACFRQWIVDWLNSLEIDPIDTKKEPPWADDLED